MTSLIPFAARSAPPSEQVKPGDAHPSSVSRPSFLTPTQSAVRSTEFQNLSGSLNRWSFPRVKSLQEPSRGLFHSLCRVLPSLLHADQSSMERQAWLTQTTGISNP